MSTVEMIAKTMGRLPKEPACPGPLLVHADGAFECHGPDSPGGTAIFHDEDALDPCHTRREVQALHTCPRCSADAELAEGVCTGQQIDHDDGTTECAAGDACVGADAVHMSSRSCRFSGRCPATANRCPDSRSAAGRELPRCVASLARHRFETIRWRLVTSPDGGSR